MTWPPSDHDPLLHLSDAARLDAAVRGRSEQRSRRIHAAEVANWIGTLRDLAERSLEVVIVTRSARTCGGQLTAVGRDHVVLRRAEAWVTLVALVAIRSVRPDPDVHSEVATGDRGPADDRTLMELLDRLAEERRDVEMYLEGLLQPVRGEILGCGQDVITIRLAGAEQSLLYVPAVAVEQVLWRPFP